MCPRTCDVIFFVKSIGKETNAEAVVRVSSYGILVSSASLPKTTRERNNGGDIRKKVKKSTQSRIIMCESTYRIVNESIWS